MFETFKIAFKLRNTYGANSFIYSLQSLPIIKKMLPDSLYAAKGLKEFACIVSIFGEIGSTFFKKLMYLLLMVFLPVLFLESDSADTFVHIFFFLTLEGGLINTHMFDATQDKYYAIFLMRMDARKYTLSDYLYFLLKTFVGFLPFTLLFGMISGLKPGTCLLLPFFVVAVKNIVTAMDLRSALKNDRKKRAAFWDRLKAAAQIAEMVVLLAIAYAVPGFTEWALPEEIFRFLAVPVVLAGILSMAYIWRFPGYRTIYKTELTADQFPMNTTKKEVEIQENLQEKIVVDLRQTSRKSGYGYLNDLFIKRHSKIMTRSARRITIVLLLVFAAAAIACMVFPSVKEGMNEMLMTSLPLFLLVMYFINRGRTITQAMFMNCDHSMLTYRFYRQSAAILSLFTERLKSVVIINLLPAFVIALGLPLLLLLSGGTDRWIHYLLLFVSIIAMSIFFSVHSLVLYYLLQPYNVELETRSAAYEIANSLTYIVCYLVDDLEIPTLIFGAGISVFCILYIIVALILVYRLAPKTFRLRQK